MVVKTISVKTKTLVSSRTELSISKPPSEYSALEQNENTGGSSSGTSSCRSTPQSVVVGSDSLSRDLSDLSGSYYHGVPGSGISRKDPKRINSNDDGSSISSIHKSWRQAYVLSIASPDVELGDCNQGQPANNCRIFLMDNSSIELVRKVSSRSAITSIVETSRIPIFVLLMDTSRKLYEILRIFVDIETDSVRDVLQSLRKNLPESWKQDYDGLLQLRGGEAQQMIHCLSIQHYETQPFECWMAKPWSMSAKMANKVGLSLVDHLRKLGMLSNSKCYSEDETLVVLTREAVSRIYEPFGSFDHYHAKSYVSFSPPFEGTRPRNRDNATSSDHSHSLSEFSLSIGTKEIDDASIHENSVYEESHEVQTLSSYSHLSDLNMLQTICEANDDELRVDPEECKTSHIYGIENDTQSQVNRKISPQSVRSLVGRLWSCSSHRSQASSESLEVHTGMKIASWDLAPLQYLLPVTSSYSDDDTSNCSSHRPLLSTLQTLK
jgi:hypothetical protein